MDKVQVNKTYKDRFTFEDTFKFVFFLTIVFSIVSLAYQIALILIAENLGMDFTSFYITPTVQIVSLTFSPVVFILYFFIYCRVCNIRIRLALSDEIKKSLLPVSVAIVLSIICIFLLSPFVNLMEYLFALMGFVIDDTIPYLAYMQSRPIHLFIGIIIMALLPAIIEEIIFRGVVLRGLYSKFGAFISILVSSVIFTLYHGSIDQTIYQLIMGIILGYLSLVGGSIVYPIILHFLNNALVIMLSVFNNIDYLNPSYQYYSNFWQLIFPILLFLLGLCLVGILFWVLKYLRNKHYFVKPKKDTVKNGAELTENKMTIREFLKSSTSNERIYFIACIGLLVVMWIVNTVSVFVG